MRKLIVESGRMREAFGIVPESQVEFQQHRNGIVSPCVVGKTSAIEDAEITVDWMSITGVDMGDFDDGRARCSVADDDDFYPDDVTFMAEQDEGR